MRKLGEDGFATTHQSSFPIALHLLSLTFKVAKNATALTTGAMLLGHALKKFLLKKVDSFFIDVRDTVVLTFRLKRQQQQQHHQQQRKAKYCVDKYFEVEKQNINFAPVKMNGCI